MKYDAKLNFAVALVSYKLIDLSRHLYAWEQMSRKNGEPVSNISYQEGMNHLFYTLQAQGFLPDTFDAWSYKVEYMRIDIDKTVLSQVILDIKVKRAHSIHKDFAKIKITHTDGFGMEVVILEQKENI